MTRTLTCGCGQMRWRIADTAKGTHLECYCTDCQTAAHALGAESLLNDAGGTAIFQTLPAHVTIEKGQNHLALLRLSPKGLFRWHAGCCGTPIANTMSSPGFSFCGMVLPAGTQGFGPVTAKVQTKAARKPVKEYGFARTGFAIMRRALVARLTGAHRKTPFFDANGQPTATPRVLSLKERQDATP